MTEFRIGDKVRIGYTGRYTLSDKQRTGVVVGERAFGYGVKIDNYGKYSDCILAFYGRELTLISGDTTSARLSEAEAEIATLKAKVAALEKAEINVTIDGETVGRNVSKGIANAPKPSSKLPKIKMFTPEEIAKASKPKYHGMCLRTEIAKTPNQRRADVIKRAQAFVADLEERASSIFRKDDGNTLFKTATTVKFFVNSEKGVVTALAFSMWSGKLLNKAFTKCHPNDVFHADIGKVIAAGKLYGVDIPQDFVDAPKPTEVVVGMRIRMKFSRCLETYDVTVKSLTKTEVKYAGRGFDFRKDVDNDAVILDDTDAVYE